MNIFILDTDPQTCARYHNDTHVSKMLLEAVQILSSTLHILKEQNTFWFERFEYPDGRRKPVFEIPYKLTHKTHPCVKWCLEDYRNYEWLHKLAFYLGCEYEFRFNKTHKSFLALEKLPSSTAKMDSKSTTWMCATHQKEPLNFTIGFNKEKYANCIFEDDIVKSYQTYYRKHKQGYMRQGNFIPYKWTKRSRPEFMESQLASKFTSDYRAKETGVEVY